MSDDPGSAGPGTGAGSARHPRVLVDALHSVLESETFRSAPKSRDLLAYVVAETIAGRGALIKERMVARVVLGRPSNIDTRTDASGRVHARRVRQRLARYYETEGEADPVRISIPLGQYAASFARNVEPVQPSLARPAPELTTGPGVAVVALRPAGGGGQDRRTAIGLTESLVQALTRFPGIRVIGPLTARPHAGAEPDVVDIGTRSGVDFVLFGRVRDNGDLLRVTMHLAHAGTGEVRWSESYDRRVHEFTGFGAEDDIVAHVVGFVGDYRGVILRGCSGPQQGSGDPEVYDALSCYYTFLDDLDPATGAEAVAALEDAALKEPRNSLVLASLGFVHAIDVLMRGPVAAAASFTRADELGQRALAADRAGVPQAHAVLAVVTLARGDLTAARKHADAIIGLTPHHPSLNYLAGMVVAASGDWDAGLAIIRRVAELDPHRPTHRRTLLAIDHLMRDDVPAALAEATLLDFPAHVYGALLRGICFAELGMDDLARAEVADLLKIERDFFDRADDLLGAAPTLPRPVVEFLCGKLHLLCGLTIS